MGAKVNTKREWEHPSAALPAALPSQSVAENAAGPVPGAGRLLRTVLDLSQDLSQAPAVAENGAGPVPGAGRERPAPPEVPSQLQGFPRCFHSIGHRLP